MKRIAIFILCLAVAMTLCSCSADNGGSDKDSNKTTIPSVSVQGENNSEGAVTTATPDPAPSKEDAATTQAAQTTQTTQAAQTTQATQAAQTTQPVETVKNEFNQGWKEAFVHNGEWSIYLGHAHWEGSELVIAIYITNGMDRDITLNRHDVIIIKDSKGNIIAREQMDLTNYVVKYNEYNTLTGTLTGDAILMPGAHLNDPGLDIYFVTNDYLCQPCNGSGVITTGNRVACAICGGIGQQQIYDAIMGFYYIACSGCAGAGYINNGTTATCPHCEGDGLDF